MANWTYPNEGSLQFLSEIYMLNVTKLGPWELKNIVKILYH